MITFYQNNPTLSNHGMLEYRNRNIWCSLIEKLCKEFDKNWLLKKMTLKMSRIVFPLVAPNMLGNFNRCGNSHQFLSNYIRGF